jgi:hypothetical protein
MTRYELELPVTFRWRDQQGHERVGAGFTHDVSAMGMFIFSSDLPPRDGILHCEIKLPRLRDAGCVPVLVSGKVVRIETGADWRQQGFAVSGEMLQLYKELPAEQHKDDEGGTLSKRTASSKRPN